MTQLNKTRVERMISVFCYSDVVVFCFKGWNLPFCQYTHWNFTDKNPISILVDNNELWQTDVRKGRSWRFFWSRSTTLGCAVQKRRRCRPIFARMLIDICVTLPTRLERASQCDGWCPDIFQWHLWTYGNGNCRKSQWRAHINLLPCLRNLWGIFVLFLLLRNPVNNSTKPVGDGVKSDTSDLTWI